MYDVIIVGGGPAGLTAGLYTARRSLRTVILSKDVGGQAATTTAIENYPGVGVVDGFELMQRFQRQAEQYGAEFRFAEVHGLAKTAEHFTVHFNTEEAETQSVILAFGLTPRSLGVPGEAQLTGKGVTYSAAAVSDQFHDKTVVVIGGGNSAIEAVNVLADVARKVYVVHRRDRFRAEAILVRKMEQHNNVEQILKTEVLAIHGSDRVSGVTVQSIVDQKQRELASDGVCINIGFMSKTNFVQDLVELNERNEVVIRPDGTTNMPGIFAAGDLTISSYKQVVVSAGDGCKAALACYTYLMSKAGKPIDLNQDWAVTSGEHFIRT